MKHDDIVALLPWYAAGSLEPEEAQAIEAHLASCSSSERAELMEELDELKLMHSAVSVDGAEEPAFRPGLIQSALLQIEAMEDAEQHIEARQTAPGFFTRLSERFGELMTQLQWASTPRFARIAVIGQLAVVIGLAAALATQAPEESPHEVLGKKTRATIVGPQYSVTFSPELDHAAVTAFLIERDLRIVDGPSALGIYTVVAPESVDAAVLLEQLSASEVSLFVAPVPP